MYKTLRFPNFKLKAVVLSYDDGVIYDRRLIEILDRYGIKCTFNLNPGLFATTAGESRRLTAEEALNLYENSSHEIASHGFKHVSLGEVDSGRASLDVCKGREELERLFNKIITGYAYPNGSFNDRAVGILKSFGVSYARTTADTENFSMPTDWLRVAPTCHHTSKNLFALVDKFLTFKETWNARPKLFYMWGHSYEFEDDCNWDMIEEFAEKIGGQEDVWYATNGELFDYVKAYDSLVYSVNGDIIKNPTDTDVYLNLNGIKVVVKAGETVKTKSVYIQ